MNVRRLVLTIIMLLLCLQNSACVRRSAIEDQVPDHDVTLSISPSPATVGETQVMIQLTDPIGKPIEGARLTLRGDMTHAGMVPIQAETLDLGNGMYGTDVVWSMAGDWILSVKGELPDGRFISRTFELIVLTPP